MQQETNDLINPQDPNVLSLEEKLKIQSEEKYRMAIRNELDPPKQKSKKWEFFNSTFGIWLLSSIVVGFITWGYTTWTDGRKAKQAKKDAISQIDLEITYRILDFETMLLKGKNYGEYSGSVYFLFNPGQNGQGISSKYASMNTRALIIELLSLVADPEKINIKQALKGINEINKIFSDRATIRADLATAMTPEDEKIKNQIIDILNSQIKIERWKSD